MAEHARCGAQGRERTGRRRVDHHAVKVQAVGVGARERDNLGERNELVDARRHCVEDVGKVGEAQVGSGAVAAAARVAEACGEASLDPQTARSVAGAQAARQQGQQGSIRSQRSGVGDSGAHR